MVPTLSQEDLNFKVDHGYIKNLRPPIWLQEILQRERGQGERRSIAKVTRNREGPRMGYKMIAKHTTWELELEPEQRKAHLLCITGNPVEGTCSLQPG